MKEISDSENKFTSWVISNSTAVLIISLVVSSVLAAGVIKLKNNPDSRVFFNEKDERLQSLYVLESKYSKTYNYFIAIEAVGEDVFTKRTLTAISRLTTDAWKIPHSTRVDSLSNHSHVTATGDDIDISPLVGDPENLSDSDLQSIKNSVVNSPSLINRVISEDLSVVGFNILIEKDDDNPDIVFDVIEHGSKLVADYREKYPELNFYISGATVYDNAFATIPASENRMLVPIMFAFILCFLGYIIRTKWAIAGVLAMIGLSVGVSLGTTGWMGAMMSAGTAPAPIMILTLSIAHCVHVMVTLSQQMSEGRTQREALHASMSINFKPIVITSLTTAVGFLSLNFSDAPPFRQLGNMVALGVIAGCILSLTLLPAVLSKVSIQSSNKVKRGKGIAKNIANFVIARHVSVVIVMGIMMFVIALGLFKIDLDDNFLTYFDEKYEIRKDTDFIQERLSGLNVIEYSFSSGEPGGVANPDYLNSLSEFVDWVKEQPNVTNANSMIYFMNEINMNMNGGDRKKYTLPDTRGLAAQYLLLYENSLPFGQELTHQVDFDKSSSRVVVFVENVTSKQLREFNLTVEKWISENIPQYNTEGTGVSIVFAYISDRNINSMLFGSLFALFFISIILIFAFRNIKIGLLSLVPNMVPAALALGVWGYLVGTVGLSISVVVAVTLGIVVDDTVHFLSKYLHARKKLDLSPSESIQYTFETVGVALFTTSVALALGFTALFLSGFRVTSEMGILSAVTIIFALVADFLFLPALLLLLDKPREVMASL